jgi:hypothetical protein
MDPMGYGKLTNLGAMLKHKWQCICQVILSDEPRGPRRTSNPRPAMTKKNIGVTSEFWDTHIHYSFDVQIPHIDVHI